MDRVFLINVFEVPTDREQEFLGLWEAADELMRRSSGYVTTRLHRELSRGERLRFVNVAELRSAEHWQSIVGSDEFRRLSARMADFHPAPGLYTVAREQQT
jgi:heme oxygenase (mycobilin-producing)